MLVVTAALAILLTIAAALPQSAAAQSAGTLYLITLTSDALYTVDTSDGTAARVHATNTLPSTPNGLAFHNGTLYLVDRTSDALYTVDTSDGTAARVGSATDFGVGEGSPSGLASLGESLYMVGINTGALYTVDTSDGTATSVHATNTLGPTTPTGLTAHNGALYLAGQSPGALYTVDTSDGTATRVHSSNTLPGSPGALASLNGTLYLEAGALYTVDTSDGTATRVHSSNTLPPNSTGMAGLDSDPPSAPQNVEAVADVRTAIALTWGAPTTANDRAPVTGYEVERSDDGSSGWADVTDTDVDTTSYRDAGLPEDTRRYYRVRATSAVDDDGAWAEADASTLRGSSAIPGSAMTVRSTPPPTPEGLYLGADDTLPGADVPLLGPIAELSPEDLPWRVLGPVLGLTIVAAGGSFVFGRTKSTLFAAIVMTGFLAVMVGIGLASAWWLSLLAILWAGIYFAERAME